MSIRGLCLTAVCLLTANPAYGQAVSGAFFALSVADAKASAQWYTEKLGLKVVMQTPKTDGISATILEGGGLIVELVQRDGDAAHPDRVQGYFKAGAIVDDYDQFLAQLKRRNVEIAYGPFPARPGQRANVIVRDNAGNLLQFFAGKP